MTHTPGPWRFDGRGGDDRIVAGRYCVALVTRGVDDGHDIQEPVFTANAHLVAAAPDLLQVAQAVANHFLETDAPLGELARAAIRKAEGL